MTTNETDLLLLLLDNQRAAFRNALSGLTEDQARSVPSASAMSLASLLNHVIDGEVAAADRIAGTQSREPDPVAAWTAGWAVRDDETVADQLARLDTVAARFADVLRADPDLGGWWTCRRTSPDGWTRACRSPCGSWSCIRSRNGPGTPATPTSSANPSTAPPPTSWPAGSGSRRRRTRTTPRRRDRLAVGTTAGAPRRSRREILEAVA